MFQNYALADTPAELDQELPRLIVLYATPQVHLMEEREREREREREKERERERERERE
jgi:hypothetical protein